MSSNVGGSGHVQQSINANAPASTEKTDSVRKKTGLFEGKKLELPQQVKRMFSIGLSATTALNLHVKLGNIVKNFNQFRREMRGKEEKPQPQQTSKVASPASNSPTPVMQAPRTTTPPPTNQAPQAPGQRAEPTVGRGPPPPIPNRGPTNGPPMPTRAPPTPTARQGTTNVATPPTRAQPPLPNPRPNQALQRPLATQLNPLPATQAPTISPELEGVLMEMGMEIKDLSPEQLKNLKQLKSDELTGRAQLANKVVNEILDYQRLDSALGLRDSEEITYEMLRAHSFTQIASLSNDALKELKEPGDVLAFLKYQKKNPPMPEENIDDYNLRMLDDFKKGRDLVEQTQSKIQKDSSKLWSREIVDDSGKDIPVTETAAKARRLYLAMRLNQKFSEAQEKMRPFRADNIRIRDYTESKDPTEGIAKPAPHKLLYKTENEAVEARVINMQDSKGLKTISMLAFNKLGEGGFNKARSAYVLGEGFQVYRALKDPTDQLAIGDWLDEETMHQKFEGRSNIVQLNMVAELAAGKDETGALLKKDEYAFMMPQFDGDLRKLLTPSDPSKPKPKELDSAERMHIAQGMLNGIRTIHEEGYVHQDLKPENIFFKEGEDGHIEAFVGDLGLAKKKENKLNIVDAGTSIYYPPKYAENRSLDIGDENPDPRVHVADNWAAGVILLELKMGKNPNATWAPVKENLNELQRNLFGLSSAKRSGNLRLENVSIANIKVAEEKLRNNLSLAIGKDSNENLRKGDKNEVLLNRAIVQLLEAGWNNQTEFKSVSSILAELEEFTLSQNKT